MTNAVERTPSQLATETAALPPARKLILAADLFDRGHGLAAIVIARAALAEMTIRLVTR